MLDVQLEVLLGLVFTLKEIAFDHVVFQTQTLGRHVDDAARTRQIHSMNVNRHFEEFLGEFFGYLKPKLKKLDIENLSVENSKKLLKLLLVKLKEVLLVIMYARNAQIVFKYLFNHFKSVQLYFCFVEKGS